jgi:histidine triad (HIT) family protein
MTYRRPCVFCEIIAGRAPAQVEHEWPDAIAIHTIKPKAPGHLLVIPKVHIQDAHEDPQLAGRVLSYAAEIAQPPCHLNTNVGGPAAQTVFHLHFHIIPRVPNQEVKVSWFKPWDSHPEDRNWNERKSTSNAKHGLSFSTELNILSKKISMKTELSLSQSINKLWNGLRS